VRLGAVKGINVALPYFVCFGPNLIKFIVEDLHVIPSTVLENQDGLLCERA
jgi:hypothetical protein